LNGGLFIVDVLLGALTIHPSGRVALTPDCVERSPAGSKAKSEFVLVFVLVGPFLGSFDILSKSEFSTIKSGLSQFFETS
jgi:hypothetical protein